MIFHISYDATDSSDCENLRKDIPKAFLEKEPAITDFTEPTKSNFRFSAQLNGEDSKRLLDVMEKFKGRCYYYGSACGTYKNDEDGMDYYIEVRRPKGGTLAASFEDIIKTAKKEILEERKRQAVRDFINEITGQ